jgi:uncharacterized coiled-coil protein SlyX
MATMEELEDRVKQLEETVLIQGDILKRILEILSSKQPERG